MREWHVDELHKMYICTYTCSYIVPVVDIVHTYICIICMKKVYICMKKLALVSSQAFGLARHIIIIIFIQIHI